MLHCLPAEIGKRPGALSAAGEERKMTEAMQKKRSNLHAGLFTGTIAGLTAGLLLFLPGAPFVSFLYTSLEIGLQAVYGVSAPLSSRLDSMPGILLLFTVGGAVMGLANALGFGVFFGLLSKIRKRSPRFRTVFAVHAGLVVAQNILLYGLIWLANIAHTLAPVTFRFLRLIFLAAAVSGILAALAALLIGALLLRSRAGGGGAASRETIGEGEGLPDGRGETPPGGGKTREGSREMPVRAGGKHGGKGETLTGCRETSRNSVLLYRVAVSTLILVLAVAVAGIAGQSISRRRIVNPPSLSGFGQGSTIEDGGGGLSKVEDGGGGLSKVEDGGGELSTAEDSWGELSTAEDGAAGLRLLLVGIDGIDWGIVDDLRSVGRLPNLDRIIEKGATARIRSIVPNLSPLVWTSVATGRRPQKHGVFGFYNIETGGEELYNSIDVKVESFWDILSAAGSSVGVVNWYVSWPVRPVKGFMVSDRFTFAGLPGRIYPEAAVSVVDSIVAALPPQLPLIDPAAADGLDESTARMALDSPAGRRARAFHTIENALFRDAAALESAVDLYNRTEPAALAVYFRSTDVASHLFWKFRMAAKFPRVARRIYVAEPSAADTLTERRLIEAVYEWNDAALGRLLERTTDGTLVCVLSDHGFGFKLPGQYSYDMNKLLSRMGLLAFEEDRARVDLSRSSLFDCRVSTGIVNLVKKMQVAVGGEDTFEDAAGRKRFLAKAEELRSKLAALETTRGDRFFGELAVIPESRRVIISGMVNVGFLNQQVLIGGRPVPAEDFLIESDISGWHRNDGFFAVSGSGVRTKRVSRCSELDIAPTILHYLGLPVPLDMDGRVLTGIFEPGSRKKVAYCDGYGIPPPSETSSLPQAGDSAEESIREQLQALGYVQ